MVAELAINSQSICRCRTLLFLNFVLTVYKITSFPDTCWCTLYHIVSVDECQISSGGCYQICKTTTDGFGCGCFNGYTLATDQQTCDYGELWNI